jgi:hypothetical protein
MDVICHFYPTMVKFIDSIIKTYLYMVKDLSRLYMVDKVTLYTSNMYYGDNAMVELIPKNLLDMQGEFSLLICSVTNLYKKNTQNEFFSLNRILFIHQNH